jgi:hypothetical protein
MRSSFIETERSSNDFAIAPAPSCGCVPDARRDEKNERAVSPKRGAQPEYPRDIEAQIPAPSSVSSGGG